MTKAKSNFCKALIALIIGLALAITAFGGIMNAKAAGEPAGEVPDGMPTGSLQDGKFYIAQTGGQPITEGTVGQLKTGYTITKPTGQNYDNRYDFNSSQGCGAILDYIVTIDPNYGPLNLDVWALYKKNQDELTDSEGNYLEDDDGNYMYSYDKGTEDLKVTFFLGGSQSHGMSNGYTYGNPYDEDSEKAEYWKDVMYYETIGNNGKGDTSCASIDVATTNITITPNKVGTAVAVVDHINNGAWCTAFNKHLIIKVIVKEAETPTTTFSLNSLAVNYTPNDTHQAPVNIATKIPANIKMNNMQSRAGISDYLDKIKFYIKANDATYTLKTVPGTSPNIHYNDDADGNVTIYLWKTDGTSYEFQDGDAIILEEGWRLIEAAKDGEGNLPTLGANDAFPASANVQYAGTEADNIKVLDREYKWVYHTDVGATSGHFGYEIHDFTGILVESEDAENGKVSIEKDLTATLTAIGLAGGELAPNCPADQDYEVSGHKVNEVTWASSDESIATVDENGVVTAKAVGTVTITATSKINNEKTATISVEVIPADAITDIEITSNKNSVEIEKTLALNLTISGGHQAADEATVVWSSSNTNVATVDDKGVVTAVGKGTATITASATTESTTTAKTDSFDVTVTLPDGYVTGATLSASKTTLTVDEKVSLTLKLEGSDDVDDSLAVEYTYSSSDTSIATVNGNGQVTAVAAGKVTITVTVTSNNSKDVTATLEITVNAADVADDNNDDNNKKSGCGSNVLGTTSVIAGVALMLAAFVLISKKRKENN